MSKDKNKLKGKSASASAGEKQDKPLVKVPKGNLGRAVFAGTQLAGAFSAVRSLREARAKHDRLALLHAVLKAAMLVVTLLAAARAVREAKAAESATAAPLMLTDGS